MIAALGGLEQEPAKGDVRRLTGSDGEWHFRVGDWRVRFTRDSERRVVRVL